jgi:hypothetical protein
MTILPGGAGAKALGGVDKYPRTTYEYGKHVHICT